MTALRGSCLCGGGRSRFSVPPLWLLRGMKSGSCRQG
jgi:hypothetical protein